MISPEQLLGVLKPPDKDNPSPFRMGNISSTYVSGKPKVKIDGESVDSTRTYPYLSSYTPAANDRVALAYMGHCWVVLGKII
jgi:hypothetical protein